MFYAIIRGYFALSMTEFRIFWKYAMILLLCCTVWGTSDDLQNSAFAQSESDTSTSDTSGNESGCGTSTSDTSGNESGCDTSTPDTSAKEDKSLPSNSGDKIYKYEPGEIILNESVDNCSGRHCIDIQQGNILTFEQVGERFIRTLTGTVVLVAILVFMIGGGFWIFSAGNESLVERGKDMMIYSIIGVLLVLGAYVIIKLVQVVLFALGT